MATRPTPLTIVCYLQGHDTASGRLRVNIATIPTGDPREPLGADFPVPAAPAFAGTTIRLLAHPASDPSQVPTLADVPGAGPVFDLAPPSEQTAIFDTLAARFTITKPPVAPERTGGRLIGKYLPASYRSAFAFTEPRTKLAVTDDSYHCARRCPPSGLPPPAPQDPTISWGDAFAVLLRQPVLARAAGLIHSVEVDAAPFLGGGFLFFSLAPGGPFHEQTEADPEFVRLYASRVPALFAAPGRSLFTPVLFPVAADAKAASALGSFDDAFSEALRFDDGFARLMHCRQPATMDPNAPEEGDSEADTRVPPASEHGIQIGWDDEDLVVTLNRQLSSTEPGKPDPAPAPPGFIGWCVDVRAGGTTAWHSLCAIDSDGIALGPNAGVGPFTDELAVEVQPSRLGDRFWLQPYATRWRSRSIAAPSRTEEMLAGNANPAPTPYAALAPDAVPMRYGRSYEFRARMRDLTGGGPKTGSVPHHAGEAPVASWRLRRFVPLAQLGIETGQTDSDGMPAQLSVRRPRIRWPEAVYAGPDNALALLEARLAAAATPGSDVDVSLPDPDADFLEIRVLVRQPRFDRFAREDGYIEFYTAYRSFPAPAFEGAETPLELELAWRDAAELGPAQAAPSTMSAPGTGPVLLPSARDVKLELRAVARDDPDYFGNARARFGPVATVLDGVVRTPVAEPAILAGGAAADRIVTVFQRAPTAGVEPADRALATSERKLALLSRRIAVAADLVESDGAVFGSPGQRLCFGVFGLAHAMAPDNASFRLTAIDDLVEKWVSVVRFGIARDWTWLGVGEPAFHVERQIVNRTSSMTIETRRSLGGISFPHVINRQAALGSQMRSRSELVILDAFPPMPGADSLPHELEVTYWITATGLGGAQAAVEAINILPVVTPPRDTPKIVSAGHAFSAYEIVGDYRETWDRRRMLWIELDRLPEDPRDGVFARVLTRAPDPLLLPGTEPIAEEPGYEGPVLDPEEIRVVRPGQGDDFAGLSAMQALIPAETNGAGRAAHYLVPLPPNLAPESPELLGFFSYEFCFGHAPAESGSPFWSTAQGRFGPRVRLEGVRHPPPTLACEVFRQKSTGVKVASEHAVAVHRGQRMPASPPATELWIAAYARLRQADGATSRNVQIAIKPAPLATQAPSARLVAEAEWSADELRDILRRWHLPEKTPLGFVAVELLPEPNGSFAEPLGADLGQVRILRTSRLVDAGDVCCH